MSETLKEKENENLIRIESNIEETEELPLVNEEEPKVKRSKKSNKISLFVLLAIIVVTPFMIFSFFDDSMDKGMFQIFDLTRGDTELDADLASEFGIMLYSWFDPWRENTTDFYMVKDYEKNVIYRMFDADSDKKLLENMVKYYELPKPTSNNSHSEYYGVCRFKAIDTLSDNINKLFGTNLEIEDAYVIHEICTLDNGGYEVDFFFYKVGEEWSVMPYLDPLKSAVDGVKKY